MPRNRSELNQVGLVVIPLNPLLPVSVGNPYVMIPSLWYGRLFGSLPIQTFNHARWASISGAPESALGRSLDRLQGLLGLDDAGFNVFFPVRTRQTAVLGGYNPIGPHIHPAIDFACKVADNTFIPLCWPVLAAMVLAGKSPGTSQLLLCFLQTGLLEAFKGWCSAGNQVGTPAPYLYVGRIR